MTRVRTLHDWTEILQRDKTVRVGNPLLRELPSAIISMGGPEELIDAIPAPPPSPLDLVTRFSVPDASGRVYVLYETGLAGGAQVIIEGTEKPLLSLGLAGERVHLGTLGGIVKTTRQIERNGWSRGALERAFAEGVMRDAWASVVMAAAASTAIPEAQDTGWRDAQAEVEEAGYEPNGILLHPRDWKTIEQSLPTLVAPTAEVAPGLVLPMLGRLAVLPTPAMEKGGAVVGDVRGLGAAMEPALDVTLTDSDREDFLSNILSIRGELIGGGVVCAPQRLRRVRLGESEA